MNFKLVPQLASDLMTLGLRSGDILIVHSSFKALGLTNHGPSDVIGTLLDYLGPEGTLVMPTFSYTMDVGSNEEAWKELK